VADGDTSGYEFSIQVASIGMTKQPLSALPHTSSRDDVYRGFFIPKGLFTFDFAFRLCVINHLAKKDL
jgi:hypothetical protein